MKSLKNIFTFLAVLIALPFTVLTAEAEKQLGRKTYKVVFEVSIDDGGKWLGALRNVVFSALANASSVIAGTFHFTAAEFFAIEKPEQREATKVSFA